MGSLATSAASPLAVSTAIAGPLNSLNAMCNGVFVWNPASNTTCTNSPYGLRCEPSNCTPTVAPPTCTLLSAPLYNATYCATLPLSGTGVPTNATFGLGPAQNYAGVLIADYADAKCTGKPIATNYFMLQVCVQIDTDIFGTYYVDMQNNILLVQFADSGCKTASSDIMLVPTDCTYKSTAALYYPKGYRRTDWFTDSTCTTINMISYQIGFGPCQTEAKCAVSATGNVYSQLYCHDKLPNITANVIGFFGSNPYIQIESYLHSECNYGPTIVNQYLGGQCFNSTRTVGSFTFNVTGENTMDYVSYAQYSCQGAGSMSPKIGNSGACLSKQKIFVFNGAKKTYVPSTTTTKPAATNILNSTSSVERLYSCRLLFVYLFIFGIFVM
ncbi:hypothetical protein BDR26DRAFT_54107 [Obelidium mucronatum]|nr:hypothetical protein BDR26DRAFT_54107 [Obelidium mucronatum]